MNTTLILFLFLVIAELPVNPYELLRMRKCIRNNALMQKLGLPVLSQLFANTNLSPEKQLQKETENSGSEYNGEDEANSDTYLSDDDLDPPTLSSMVLIIS